MGLLAGCVNPYAKYYVDKTGGGGLRTRGIKVFSEAPQLIHGNSLNPDEDVQAMFGEGYVPIGVSSFNGREFSADLALEQARKVGATRVIVYEKYTETEHSAVPVVLPTFGSAFSQMGRTAVSTTVVGSTTAIVPTSVRRYDQGATYWAPSPHGVGDFFSRNLNNEERTRLQSDKGVVVIGVRRGGPAFEADILKGDILRAVNSTEIEDTKSLGPVLKALAGQTVTFTVVRGDQTLEKTVHLNPDPAS